MNKAVPGSVFWCHSDSWWRLDKESSLMHLVICETPEHEESDAESDAEADAEYKF